MEYSSPLPISRRLAFRRGVAAFGGLAASAGLLKVRASPAQADRMTASGGGVNLKLMPHPGNGDPIPLRELFSFDSNYAQCVIEDNPTAFAMETYEMGRVVVDAHTFFMAMYALDISLVSVAEADGGKRVAKLTGDLGCLTEAGTATGRVGSRTASEPAFFEIEATDGGHGGGAAGDSFVFTVFFDPKRAPINHGIFGPNPAFTGELVAGEVTIASPSTQPLLPSSLGRHPFPL